MVNVGISLLPTGPGLNYTYRDCLILPRLERITWHTLPITKLLASLNLLPINIWIRSINCEELVEAIETIVGRTS